MPSVTGLLVVLSLAIPSSVAVPSVAVLSIAVPLVAGLSVPVPSLPVPLVANA